jgi:catechol-2,3-dioxygenase
MPNPNIAFDHVHLMSKNPQATAQWYVDKLGGDDALDGVSVELLNRKDLA